MADIHDAMEAESQARSTLKDLQTNIQDEELVLSTKAICEAILAVGIRLDYVLRDISKNWWSG